MFASDALWAVTQDAAPSVAPLQPCSSGNIAQIWFRPFLAPTTGSALRERLLPFSVLLPQVPLGPSLGAQGTSHGG